MQATNTFSSEGPIAIPMPNQANYRWILHPAIDILLCCGGAVWLTAFAMATGLIPDLANPTSPMVNVIFYTSFALFVFPHQLATYMRVYDVKATRETMGAKIALLFLLALAIVAFSTISPLWASLIGRLTFAFSFQHFYAQAYGIALIYCYKRGYILNPSEKRTFSALIQAGIWFGIAMFCINGEPYILKIKLVRYWPPLPNWLTICCEIALFAVAATFIFVVIRKWILTKQFMPLPALLIIMTAFFLFAYLPSLPTLAGSLLVLYTIGHAFFHTPQYLVVTTAFHIKNHGLTENTPYSKILTQLWRPTAIKYFVFLYCSAALILLFVSSWLLPTLSSSISGMTAEKAWFAWICFINLHHYWTDALIWRMKDKKTLNLLIA